MIDFLKLLVSQHFDLLFFTAAILLALIIAGAIYLFSAFQANPNKTWQTVMLELSVFRKVRRLFSKGGVADADPASSARVSGTDLSGTIAPGTLNIKDFKDSKESKS